MKTFTRKTGVEERIAEYVKGAQKMIDEHWNTRFPNCPKRTLGSYVFGESTRYAKIFANDGDSKHGSVWAFIDLTDGNIYKPASYKAPAKHARGNVFAADYGLSMTLHSGPCYLR